MYHITIELSVLAIRNYSEKYKHLRDGILSCWVEHFPCRLSQYYWATVIQREGDVSRMASRGGPLTHCRDTVSTRILGSTLPLPLLPPCRRRRCRRRREFGCWVSVPAAAMGPCQRAQIERTASSSSLRTAAGFVSLVKRLKLVFFCHSSKFKRVHK